LDCFDKAKKNPQAKYTRRFPHKRRARRTREKDSFGAFRFREKEPFELAGSKDER